MTIQANDSLKSVVGGLGDAARDKSAASMYGFVHLTTDQIINSYRSSWVIRKLIDIPAKDAFRQWRDWQGKEDQIKAIKALEKKKLVKKKLVEAYTQARLWGGSAIYIGTDQDPEKPFEPSRVQKDGVKFLTVLSCSEISATNLNQDATDSNYGNPDFYQINNSTLNQRIHHSHLVILTGNDHPCKWYQEASNYGFGDSILQSVYTAAKQSDSVNANVASLIFESNVDVIRAPDFMASLGDAEYQKKIIERYTLAAKSKGINGTLILDKEEEYDRKAASFQTLDKLMMSFAVFAAASQGIPVTKFLGKSAEGMNSTGEGDMKNYHDDLQGIQELDITPAMELLDEALIRSALGDRPDDIEFNWSPFEQMSEVQITDIADKTAKTAETLVKSGLYDPSVIQEATTNQFVKIKAFPGIDNLTSEGKSDFGFNEPDEE